MNALLLLAGTGTRLRPFTDTRPKCLVELGGQPLLAWQIDSLRKSGIERVSAVVGYQRQALEPWVGKGLDRIYVNPDFESTNMVTTLFKASEELSSDLVISYGDIIYSPEIVAQLRRCEADISVVVDLRWLDLWKMRFENPLADAETLVMDPSGRIQEIGQKPQDFSRIMAQYIGLIKLTREGARQLVSSYENARRQIERGGLAWGKVKNLDKAYMTDLLQGLISEGRTIQAVPIRGNWLEVDSVSDLSLYQNLLHQNTRTHSNIFNLGRD